MNASATAEQTTSDADRQQLNQGVYDALIEMAQRDGPARARRAAFDIIGPVTIKLLPWVSRLGIASAVVWFITA